MFLIYDHVESIKLNLKYTQFIMIITNYSNNELSQLNILAVGYKLYI